MYDLTSDPAKLGFDAGRLARIKPWMRSYVDQGKFPGAMTLIARRGEIAYCDWTGRMDIEGDRPWARDTMLRIYSMTKPLTSVGLLMLYEDAHCHLDDPVDAYLPEFADRQVLIPGAERIDQVEPAKTRMTLHHLLTHTSGLTYGFNEGVLSAEMEARGITFSPRRPASDKSAISPDRDDLAQMVRDLSELPLNFDPGSRWNYSVSTDVVGRVIEVISGQPLDRFFAERILGPLGMEDTGFTVPEAKLDRMASCYVKMEEDPLTLLDSGRESAFREGEVRIFSGGGGLVSTPGDYLRFAEMLRGGGRLGDVRLLSPKTVEVMTRNALPGDLASMGQAVFAEVPFDGIGFGLGVAVMLDPAIAKTLAGIGDYGWGGMASTVFWIDPAAEMTVIFVTQLVPSSSYPNRKELRALAYSSLTDA